MLQQQQRIADPLLMPQFNQCFLERQSRGVIEASEIENRKDHFIRETPKPGEESRASNELNVDRQTFNAAEAVQHGFRECRVRVNHVEHVFDGGFEFNGSHRFSD